MDDQDTQSSPSPPRRSPPLGSNLRNQWRGFWTAVAFLTRLPTPLRYIQDAKQIRQDLRLATRYFPLVGALIGAVTTGIVLGSSFLWPFPVAVLLGLAIEAVLTGAFHEDAVADFFDAFGGGWTRDDILRILKDSRIGSFGLVGLGMALALRAGGMMSLDWQVFPHVLIASTTLGRWNILVVMSCVPPVANRESVSKDVGQQIGFVELIWGTGFAIPGWVLVGWTAPLRLVVMVLVSLVFGLCFGVYLRRKLGGVTGDCLGCAAYVTQVIVLLVGSARIQ